MKGLPFFDRKNTKGVPFLSKIVYRGIRGWTLGRRVATLNFFEYLLRPVTRILYGGGGGANETKVDQTTEMYILLSDPFI